MNPPQAPHTWRIEPFDPHKHDRSGFSCGVSQVDNYFRKTANKLARAGNTRLFVACTETQEVAGFYALNAHSVHYADLPKKYARTRPAHGLIPAAYISMIGRDVKFRSMGLGGILLVNALIRIVTAADSVGMALIMLDVLDCGDADRTAKRKKLYASYGFTELSAHPLRMFLPMETARKLVGV